VHLYTTAAAALHVAAVQGLTQCARSRRCICGAVLTSDILKLSWKGNSCQTLWMGAVPLEFLRTALGGTDLTTAAAAQTEWRPRLEYAVYEHLGALRISEFFNIIVDFPDSLSAVGPGGYCSPRHSRTL